MTQDAIDRAARRLMALRPSENTVNPYKLVSVAVNALIDKRCTDPLAHIPVVTTKEFLALIDLPDATSNRPPNLVDLYPGGVAEYRNARRRLVAAGLRHGYPAHNPRICWGCDGVVDEATLACDCYTPAKTRIP